MLVDIAKGVHTELTDNAETLGIDVVNRTWEPVYNIDELEFNTSYANVYTSLAEITRQDRSGHVKSPQIQIQLVKRFVQLTVDEADDMVSTLEAIADHFTGHTVDLEPPYYAICMEVEYGTVSGSNSANRLNQYIGVVSLTYRV